MKRVDIIARTGEETLVAKARADGDTATALGAAAIEDGRSALGLHACAESVDLQTATTIWLKCALGHRTALLNLTEKSLPLGKF